MEYLFSEQYDHFLWLAKLKYAALEKNYEYQAKYSFVN